jgi:hypothetical protein
MSEWPPEPLHSHRVYSHEGIIVISYSPLLYTGPVMWHCVSPPVSLLPITSHRASARQGLRFHPRVTCSTMASISMNTWGLRYDPVLIVLSRIMRCEGVICESMYAEANHAWGRQRAIDSRLWARIFLNPAELTTHGDAGGPSLRGLWPTSPTYII